MNNENSIIKVDFSDELKKSYIDYSMSVITSRAIPDIRDGLKPVQRKILFDMDQLNVGYDKPTKKCARIVGDTMGKYHPHGDSSIYDALIVMTQPFKKRVPLIFGQGNIGSVEGDGAAAQRYAEARLEHFTQDVLLADLDRTVKFVPNYDNTETEPEVLPARLPMILINGSEGIAVGMATSIPTHNVGEICDLCRAYIDNPKISTSKMLVYLHGPDFPSGGIISNKKDLLNIYETGTGKIKVRGKVSFEKAANRREHDRLVVTEIPYTMIGSGIEKFMSDVAGLVMSKKLPEILDISNQSNKEGIRIVLELKPGSDVKRIESILYKKTRLEDTFGVNMLAISNATPRTFSLAEIMNEWHEFQKDILTRKYKALLEKFDRKKEIEEGLIKAYDCIDLIIEVLRGSKTVSDARTCLTLGHIEGISFKSKTSKAKAAKLSFTEAQADAILKLPLQRLIGLEIESLLKEHGETLKKIEEYNGIIKNESKLNATIKKDLSLFKENYSTERKTEIMDCEEIIYEEKPEVIEGYLLIDRFRYCKMIDNSTFERNKETIQEQYKFCIKTTSISRILVFTDAGTVCQIKCEDIPLCKYKEKGEPVENLSPGTSDKDILHIVPMDMLSEHYIIVTQKGYIKRLPSSEFVSSKKEVMATKLSESDRVSSILPYKGEKYLLLCSSDSRILKINANDIPVAKKNAAGSIGMRLDGSTIECGALASQTDQISVFGMTVKVSDLKAGKRGTPGRQMKPDSAI